MPDSPVPLARLKRRIARIGQSTRTQAGLFTLGHDTLDTRLGGGLALGALHEVCAGRAGAPWAASGFALMLALRAATTGPCAGRPLLWVREDRAERMWGGLYAPGLAELGVEADRVILVQAPDTLSALRAGADIAGAIGPGALVIEPFGEAKALDLTASRKLVLAAESSDIAAFILRDSDTRLASAAATRWRVEAAPSTLLEGNAPGQTLLRVGLARHRGGIAPFETLLEWNRDEHIFREPAPLSGAAPAPAERGQMAA